MTIPIKLYNTFSRQLEELAGPQHGDAVKMYSCGPTVYHDAHIGNMRAFITADILKKILQLAGHEVQHVMNITDVGHLTDDGDMGEDKMLKAMRREGKTASEIAEIYTERFIEDAQLMNIDLPTGKNMPRATAYIAQQIEMIQQLEAKGLTYTTSDGVYYDTSKLPNYGELARLDKENLQAGARVELGEKRNATDFALWKFSPAEAQRDMEWESPWVGPYGNKGFPGWHIECSAMSRELLGDTFDIHTGGIDHIPVHHTNEIAQSVPLCGCGSKSKSHVDFWVHNEFVVLQDEAKMSKSSGNFLTVCGLKERGFHPLALRYLYLQTHYRKSVKFDFDILAQAQTALKRLWLKVVELEQVEPAATDLADSFVDAFATDLDTASVLGLLHGSLKNDDPAAQKYNLLLADQVLGLDFAHAQQRLDELAALSAVGEVPAEIAELLAQRVAAKAARDFATADALRDQIQAAGYKVVDTAGGAKLERL